MEKEISQSKPSGFTLLELLIVIGILAVLATVTVLVLNPAELLRQARDSQRVSDLATLNGALSLYLTSVNPVVLDAGGTRCKGDAGVDSCFVDNTGLTGAANTCEGAFPTSLGKVALATKGVAGTDGWLPVNLGAISGGSPIPALPRDPTLGTSNFYGYMCDYTGGVTTYKLATVLESVKYRTTDDLDGKDGNNNNFYETGTDPGLDL